MTLLERTHRRDLSYSAWHRPPSVARYLDRRQADDLAMIDVDCVEYDRATGQPLALIELARDIGQRSKCASVTARLAELAGLPAVTALYRLSDEENPAAPGYPDIESVRYRLVAPRRLRQTEWTRCTPDEWCRRLAALRKGR